MFIKINIWLNYAGSWLVDLTYFYDYNKKKQKHKMNIYIFINKFLFLFLKKFSFLKYIK